MKKQAQAAEVVTYKGVEYVQAYPDELRPLSKTEFADLEASGKSIGVRQAVTLAGRDVGPRRVLDGWHRLKVAAKHDLPVEFVVCELSEEKQHELATELNASRRQLTPKEIREARKERLKVVKQLHTAGASQREIARETGASKTQIKRDIDEVVPPDHLPPENKAKTCENQEIVVSKPVESEPVGGGYVECYGCAKLESDLALANSRIAELEADLRAALKMTRSPKVSAPISAGGETFATVYGGVPTEQCRPCRVSKTGPKPKCKECAKLQKEQAHA